MSNESENPEQIVNVQLRGARVTDTFREALFDSANRAGLTPNEFCLRAAAEKIVNAGREISGIFKPGDLDFRV